MSKSLKIEDLDSASRLQILVEAVTDYAIYLLSPEGRVLSWNSGARRLKGYEEQEIIGEHFSRFYTPEDQASQLPKRALETAAREGRFESEGWRVRKDGSRFWALVIVDPVLSDGKLIGFAKVTRDVTERMKTQNALKEAQEQLAASQKMEAIGQLSGGIAHDFNNLMMIVIGNLETAQREGGDHPKLQRSIQNAMRGAQRSAALTSRLLAFSRRQALNPKPLELNKFLTGAAEFLQRTLGETIEIESVGAAGLWLVEVDSNHLEAALVNLAINARDAMPAGGKLTIETANAFLDSNYCRTNPELIPGRYVVISVSDTGEGMSAEVLSRAFEPFFTTKDPGHGTGLGLSQVYGFVKQSGGNLKIYSEQGQGTTVKIYLPRFVSLPSAEEVVSDERLLEGEQGETVLVVEDNPDVRSYLTEILQSLNYRVLTAANGQAALNFLSKGKLRIDLMLTDVVMPGLNGRQLAQKAHELRPGLKIIFMSGYSQNAIIHGGRLEDGIELLEKPIYQTMLASRVREALDGVSG